jgi:hypothetical protein
MFSRRTLTVGLILGLMVAMLASLSVSAQEEPVTLSGSASFRDADALSDSLVIDLGGVDAPAAGTKYEGWLKDTAGNVISVGTLTRTSGGEIKATHTDAAGANLLATYQVFIITAEPDPDPSTAPSGVVVYSDAVETGAFAHVGHLVVGFSSNPNGKGIATGLLEQAGVALAHANLAKSSSTLADKQKHAQHVINIIEGTTGANFDAGPGNPGDGKGIVNYAADAASHASLAKEAAPDNETVAAHADVVIASANNVIASAEGTRNNALQVLAATEDNIIVEISLNNMIASATRALNGRDVDGDGKVRPFDIITDGAVTATADEGGSKLAYTSSQDMAQFVPLAGDVGTPGVGDALVPPVMLGVLLAGMALAASGGLLMRRRREGATV